jgi:formylglycine-generating enzyme required for sulfatase activity
MEILAENRIYNPKFWRALGVVLALTAAPACDGDKDDSGETKDAKKTDEKKTAKADTKDGGDTKTGADTKADSGESGDAPPKPSGPCPAEMALIDGGTFFIGTQKDSKVLGRAKPSHKVRMSSFCIDKNEVTVADYDKCVEAGECEKAHEDVFYPQGSADEEAWINERKLLAEHCNSGKPDRKNHPVNCVTWFQANSFCKFKGGRLPTEAEWEYAARGSDGRVYPWGDEPPSQVHANTCGSECVKWRTDNGLSEHPPMFEVADAFSGTAPVGSFPKGTTPQGVNDLIGNVFEWTATRDHVYEDAEEEDPKGPAEGESYVIRGGAFNSYFPDFTDPALRFPQVEKAHVHAIGFRCAADVRE